MSWVSPLPKTVQGNVRTFMPGADVRQVAAKIIERAWTREGVRVFRWPCNTIALTTIGSRHDAELLVRCVDCLLGTWTRGALERDVLATLRWARTQP